MSNIEVFWGWHQYPYEEYALVYVHCLFLISFPQFLNTALYLTTFLKTTTYAYSVASAGRPSLTGYPFTLIPCSFASNCHLYHPSGTLGTRGNSLAKSGRPKAGETNVRSEMSEASEGPNASSLWWRTPMVSLCLIQILYLITDWLFKNVFLPATAVGQKRSREMNRFFQ